MHRYFQEQLERIDRLLTVVFADDQHALTGNLLFEDVLFFAFQSIWHMKDWVLNDPEFRPKSKANLENEIHSDPSLLVCADLANGSKHFVLKHPKTSCSLSPHTGIRLESSKGVFQVHYYIVSSNKNDPFHGTEVRDFLRQCRDSWQRIIDKHHCSRVEI